jgi:hypothetical protein
MFYELKVTYLYRPAHITSRIVAQDGWFTLHKYIEDKGEFLPLEKQRRFKEHLTKHLVPAGAYQNIREGLQRLGISDAVLFPDLEKLSKDLVARTFSRR